MLREHSALWRNAVRKEQDVVRTQDAARAQQTLAFGQKTAVLHFGGVEKDEIEHILQTRQNVCRVSLEKGHSVRNAEQGKILPCRSDARGLALDGRDAGVRLK